MQRLFHRESKTVKDPTDTDDEGNLRSPLKLHSTSKQVQDPTSLSPAALVQPSKTRQEAVSPEREADALTPSSGHRSFVAGQQTPNTLSSAFTARPRRLSSSSAKASPALSGSSAVVTSYFQQQPGTSGATAKSPAQKRPPASFSSNGTETSHGPPVALISRGSYRDDISRRSQTAQSPADFTFAVQQLAQLGLASPGAKEAYHLHSESNSRGGPSPRKHATSAPKSEFSLFPESPHQRPYVTRAMTANIDIISPADETFADAQERQDSIFENGAKEVEGRDSGSTTEGQQSLKSNEDLFMKVAQDSPQQQDSGSEVDFLGRQRTRNYRSGPRKSFPANSFPSQRADHDVPLPSIETRQLPAHRRTSRTSHLPSPPTAGSRLATRDKSPLSPATRMEKERSRYYAISPRASFSSSQDTPQLPQFGRRRPSFNDNVSRNAAYRPSHLQYASSRDNESVHIDTPEQSGTSAKGADGSESVDSGPPPSAVWDELDELKNRIRNLESSGRLASASNTSGERPRTATTTVTTISSSPKRTRKQSLSPTDGAPVGGSAAANIHPTLHSALAKCKTIIEPKIYRTLEATASDALELAAMTGSAGPQGTAFSAASIINGVTVPDRQVRRKADNVCRSLTELCVALYESTSPAAAAAAAAKEAPVQRRPSVSTESGVFTPSFTQQARASVEPEGGAPPRSSPSRALHRIEQRRTSQMGLNSSREGTPRDAREGSVETGTPSQTRFPSRFDRAGTSLLRNRRTTNEDDDEDPTLRAPSRAMTEYTQLRPATAHRSNRLSREFGREYTSNHPMPDKLPSPTLHHSSSLRRSIGDASQLAGSALLRDRESRRYYDRGTPPTAERGGLNDTPASEERRQRIASLSAYNPSPRTSSGLGRAGSLKRTNRPNNVSTGKES